MAATLKNALGTPLAATPYQLYICPASTTTTISTLEICNRNAGAATVRVWVTNGVGDFYSYYDLAIAGYDSFNQTIGKVLVDGDEYNVYSDLADVDFSISFIETA